MTIDSITVTRYYLYGSSDIPQDRVDDKLIRAGEPGFSSPSNPTLYQDVQEFMTTGGGRPVQLARIEDGVVQLTVAPLSALLEGLDWKRVPETKEVVVPLAAS